MKFNVYVDYTTETTPRPFYVGKGCARRLRSMKRNKFHARIAAKYGIERRVVFETDNECEAFDKERELIIEHGTFAYGDGWGANFTLGGEGTAGHPNPRCRGETHPMFGRKHTEESKRKNSESNRLAQAGEKNAMFGKHHSEETRKKIGDAERGWHHTEESKAKIAEKSRINGLGRKHSAETKKKISEAHLGKEPWNKGKKLGKRVTPRTFSEQARKNISEGCKGRVPWNKGRKQSVNEVIKTIELASPA